MTHLAGFEAWERGREGEKWSVVPEDTLLRKLTHRPEDISWKVKPIQSITFFWGHFWPNFPPESKMLREIFWTVVARKWICWETKVASLLFVREHHQRIWGRADNWECYQMALKGLIENQFVGRFICIEWTSTTGVGKTFGQTRFEKRVASKSNSPKSGRCSGEIFCLYQVWKHFQIKV